MSDERDTTSVYERPGNPSSGAGTKPATAPGSMNSAAAAEAPTKVVPAATEPRKRPAPAATPARPGAAQTRDRTGRVRTSGGAVRPTRKARLRIARLDLWSVMKTALMFSLAAGVALFVAVTMLWGVVEASGALEKLQETLNALLGNPDGSGQVQVSAYVDRWRVLGFTAVVSAANVVLLTALATLAALLYNLTSSVLGGLEVTLAED